MGGVVTRAGTSHSPYHIRRLWCLLDMFPHVGDNAIPVMVGAILAVARVNVPRMLGVVLQFV